MGGCDPDEPRTRGTSCAIPSWNVPKLIFEEGETEKVSPKMNKIRKKSIILGFFHQI